MSLVRWISFWGMWGMWKKIRIYCLALKYFMQGDEWKFAVEYAEALVKGWK
jgi:hypothetical protein